MTSGADSPEPGLTRSFGWSNMFVSPEDDPRTDGGFGDERATLVGYLRDYRLTLDADLLRERVDGRVGQ